MASNDDLITGLMIKYARHEKLTDEEMRILEEWWQQSPEHRQLAEQFGDEEWVRAELARMKPAPMKEMWREINNYLDEIGAPDDRATPMEWEKDPVRPRRRWIAPLSIAASVAVVAGAVWLLVGKTGTKDGGGTAVSGVVIQESVPIAREDGVLLVGSDGSRVDLNAVPIGTIVSRTKYGYAKKMDTNQLALYRVDDPTGPQGEGASSRQTVLVGSKHSPFFVRLADGSNVWLSHGTFFEYAMNGGARSDTFDLRGKGYFDVTKEAARSFVVCMPHGRTAEVLGTTFNIEAEEDDSTSRVSLLRGKLRVRNGADTVLVSGHQAVLSPGKLDVHPMPDPMAVTAWVKQSLYFHFDNTEFMTAINAVASWYGYTVSNPKKLRGVPLTVVLPKDPSPDSVVSKIGQIEGGFLYVWIRDRVIYVSDTPPPPKA